MGPDSELLAEAVGVCQAVVPVESGGHTRSHAWRVTTAGGAVFVKQAEEAGSLRMLRREALVYREVRGPFLPAYVGFADSGERACLALEFLEDAHWPPPYPGEVSALFEALELVATAEPPLDLPAQKPRWSRWQEIADDPRPFLALRLCSRAWFEQSLEALVEAEASADVTGEALVHNDVYSGNVGFTRRGAVLVDWGAAVRGSAWIDTAFALLSIRVEGGKPPVLDVPGEPSYAAALAGHLAVEAPAPLPDWAEPGSTLREDQAGDLLHALRWSADLLDLPPLS